MQSQLDQLRAQAFAEAEAKQKLDTDPEQNAYVRCAVDALVARLPPLQWRGTRWETAVFVDAEPNAFALPGGKVGNTGIFTVASNQDESGGRARPRDRPRRIAPPRRAHHPSEPGSAST